MKQSNIIISLTIVLIGTMGIFLLENTLLDIILMMTILLAIFYTLNSYIRFKDDFITFLDGSNIVWKNNKKNELYNSSYDDEQTQFILNKISNGDKELSLKGLTYEVVVTSATSFLVPQVKKERTNNYIKKVNYVGYIKADNIKDSTEILDADQEYAIYRETTEQVNNYFNELDTLIIKLQDAEWIFFLDDETYKKMSSEEFKIIKQVQTSTAEHGAEISMTMGIAGSHKLTLKELEEVAESALRIADSRGGGQVVVDINGKQQFFGGMLRTFEKRSKVRVRAFANAMRREIASSSNVIIMGHKNMDMDCFAASLGVLSICRQLDKEAFVVFDYDGSTYDVRKAYDELKNTDPNWASGFIHGSVGNHLNSQSLLIVVDVTSTDLIQRPEIVDFFDRKIIIDHHIVNDKTIQGSTVTYVETYASSTAEIITELFDYLDGCEIGPLTATILLAGILVDTKNFVNNTGSRTFEAAAALRARGATTEHAQRYSKDDFDSGVRISNLVGMAKIISPGFACVVSNEILTRTDLAKAADILVSYENTKAAFAIGKLENNTTFLSARSNGEIMIHQVVEILGGGGHSTAAAANFSSKSPEQVFEMLQKILGEENESNIN